MKIFLLLFFAFIQSTLVWAQSDFPNKPVTIVVATPAGGATDKTVRLLVKQLQTKWKNGVIVENRIGASGNIASAYVAKANPDGYTLLVSAGPFCINPSLFKTLPFDTKKDFVPISQISSFASVLLVHESFPGKTLNDFVTVAKNPKEPLAYASAGSGTAQHLGMELLKSKLKLNLNHIPYKGGAPAMNDLLAGHVKVMLAGMGDASPHLNTGRVFPLVTTGKARSPLLPTIPTLQELGILDFDASGWCGLHAPAGTPADIIQRINQDVVAALADPSVRQGMAAMDVDPRPTSVAEFRAFMDSQFAKWKEAVELSGAKAD
jgi:tripartite-type tricarboxylate transporter receptor subunit TctC